MIRAFRGICFSPLTVALALALFGIAITGSIVRAGDADGVLGYSMRLKNKDFSNENGAGSGGSGVTGVTQSTGTKSTAVEPQLAEFDSRLALWSTFAIERNMIWFMLRLR